MLRSRGYEVDEQEIFVTTFQEIDAKLAERVGRCDAVVFLVGFRYGGEPNARPAGRARRSYTQLEYDFARAATGRDGRPLPYALFLAQPGTPFDSAAPEEGDAAEQHARRNLQLSYREELENSGHDWTGFQNLDQLLRHVALMRFPWEPHAPTVRGAKPCNLPGSIGTLFKGRDPFLDDVRRRFRSGSQAAVLTQRQAIHGLGGVGKTRAAVEYGWRFADDYEALLFVTADSPANLETHLAGLAGVLGVVENPQQQPDDVKLAAVMDWLARHPGWLLVLDNVDTPEAAAAVERRVAHVLAGRGHLLLTSRIANWRAGVTPLALDVLSEDDATTFLLERTADQRTARPDDAAIARVIARELDGLALALEQAAAWVGALRCPLGDYLKAWRTSHAAVLEWHDPLSMDYLQSVAATWLTTFERLSDPAQRLLELLAFLAAEPIPPWLFHPDEAPEIPLTDGDRELRGAVPGILAAAGVANVRLALADLLKFSLVRRDETGMLVVHRLLQEITRGRLDAATARERLESALRLVNALMPFGVQDVRCWPVATPLAGHAVALVAAAERADIAEPTARLAGQTGLCFRVAARHALAEPLYRTAVAIDERSYGHDHPKVATDLNNLAQLLQDTNRLAEAEPLMRRALAIDERSYGPDHPNVAIRLNNLATLLQATNRIVEAEPLMRRALAIDERSYGPDHPNVAISLNSLAVLLKYTNRLAEAEPLMRRAVGIFEQSYGTDHPNVATALNNLASLLQDTNRLAEAEPLKRRALTIDERSYGSDHPNVAIRLSNLAQLLLATNRLAEAEPLMRRALAIDERSLGPDHPDVATDLNNLAQLLQDTNRLAEAEPLMRRALTIDERSYGHDHPSVATSLNNLAQLLQATNRLAEAEPLMRRAVEITQQFNRATGHTHPHWNTYLANYRGLLAAMGLGDAEIVARLRPFVG